MIPLPDLPKVVQKKDRKCVLEIGPLYPGYGVTVGNTFRRVLLSSLEGAAITQVKIKGVEHEFSTLPGVMEDILIILLNLKKIRFKDWAEEPQTLSLDVKGEKEVKAGDFRPNPNVEIANPETHIATLTEKKAELQIEVVVEKGIGYVLSEERGEEKAEVGVIPLDAIFSPVENVNFRVENVRVGKRTDFERVELEVETDGTISPEEAFSQAAKILLDHFTLFSRFGQEEKKEAKRETTKGQKTKGEGKSTKKKEDKETKEKESSPKEDKGISKVEDMALGERVKNILLKEGLKTVKGLAKKSEKDLLSLEGIGESGLKEIKKALKKVGQELK